MDLTLPTGDRIETVADLIERLEELDPLTPLTQLSTRPVGDDVWIVHSPMQPRHQDGDDD